MGKERVPLSGLELLPGGHEDALIEPSGGAADGEPAAVNGMARLADELPGAIAIGLGAGRQGVVDPDEIGPPDFRAGCGVGPGVIGGSRSGGFGGDFLVERCDLAVQGRERRRAERRLEPGRPAPTWPNCRPGRVRRCC